MPFNSTICPRNCPKRRQKAPKSAQCAPAPRNQERAVSWATWLKNEFRGHLVHPQAPTFYGFQASESPNETRRPPYQWPLGAAGGPASPRTMGANGGSTGVPGAKKMIFFKVVPRPLGMLKQGGSGRRVRDEPHDRARRGHAPCKPRRGDHRGCERRVERATTGAARHAPPPPLQRDGCRASCLRHESNEGKTTSPPPPTHASAPPTVGDAGREGRTAAPPPEDKAARWGGSGERVRDGLHDRAQGKQAPCRPQRGGHRGSERRLGRAMTGATRRAPLPSRRTSAAPRASAVPATCLRRRKGSEGAPPSPPPTPTPTKERGEGSEGMARGHGG